MDVKITLNGKIITDSVDTDMVLLDFCRKHNCYSVKRGCESGNCGLCTVLLDGKPILSCSTPVGRANGRRVDTLEGLQEEAKAFTRFFAAQGADQCGFCNPGYIVNIVALLRENSDTTDEEILMLWLGTDNDMNADWENGVFYDNFRGVWGSIDGNMVFMELSDESEDYTMFSVPILLNGEEYNLQVVYDFTTEEWSILGARQGIDDTGMADKELRLLEEGDEITTIWYAATATGDDDFEAYTADTFTVTADISFDEMELPDGSYSMVYEMRDAMDNYAYSDAVIFDCADGEIQTTVFTE